MYIDSDKHRCYDESGYQLNHYSLGQEEYRSEFRRDYARLLHSPSFRRLQGKTQLYPSSENDFFRNRLTHSLEVAQIAKSIAIRLNHVGQLPEKIDLDIVEFAGLAHDIGHPPFGHQGEEALDECLYKYGGFEGNAQTLRVLARLEKKFLSTPQKSFSEKEDLRYGLNLTYRTLASILKYDVIIPENEPDRKELAIEKGQHSKVVEGIKIYPPVKGYYSLEKKLVEAIKSNILGEKLDNFNRTGNVFKTIECQIMDIADDIAYSTYDMEDAIKAGFYNFLDLLTNDTILTNIAVKINNSLFDSQSTNEEKKKEEIKRIISTYIIEPLINSDIAIFQSFSKILDEDISEKDKFTISKSIGLGFSTELYKLSKSFSNDSYFRTSLTSSLVGNCIRNININFDSEFPCLSTLEIDKNTRLFIEVLKKFNYESQILSARLKVAEYRGKEIVKAIFQTIIESNGILLPPDYRDLYASAKNNRIRYRIVGDFIASMTDKYCIEYYGRLTSENPETIFKPL